MYSITTALVKRLSREAWGTKILDNEGNRRDTMVQPLVDEALAGLTSTNPIDLAGPLLLNAPAGNGPSIIINRFVTDSTVQDNIAQDNTNVIDNTWGVQPPQINGGTIRFIDQAGRTIDIPGPDGSVMNITNADGSPGPTGATGSVTVVSGVTGSVSVSGCTATLTLTPTYTTLTFLNGLFQGAS